MQSDLFVQDCEQCGSYNHMIDICSHRFFWQNTQLLLIIKTFGKAWHLFSVRRMGETWFARTGRNLSATSAAPTITCSRFPWNQNRKQISTSIVSQCKEKDNERNGRNKLDEEGTKPRCVEEGFVDNGILLYLLDWPAHFRCNHCGSWDHLSRACTHTYFAGRWDISFFIMFISIVLETQGTEPYVAKKRGVSSAALLVTLGRKTARSRVTLSGSFCAFR